MTPKTTEQASPDVIERLQSDHHMTQGDGLGAMLNTAKEAAAKLAQLQAELAEAHEVPGRIAEWLREKSDKQHDKGYGREAGALSDASDAIEARDWSKP